MKTTAIFLCLLALLSAACGGGNVSGDGAIDNLKTRAKVAEVNLTRIRDAIIKYHKAKGEVPRSITHLEEYGGGEQDLEPSTDYADIGYAFFNVTFEDGKMTQGWFIATPVTDSGALQVRMNGVTGEFDYVPHNEDFGPAPGTLPPDNSKN